MPIVTITGALAGFGPRRKRSVRAKIVKNTLDAIEEDYQNRMKKVYRTQSSGGMKWAPNDPHYLSTSKRKGGGRGISTRAPGRKPGERTFETKLALTLFKNQRIKDGIRFNTRVPGHIQYSLYDYSGKLNSRRVPVRDPFLAIFGKDGKILPVVNRRWRRIISENATYFVRNSRKKVRRRI